MQLKPLRMQLKPLRMRLYLVRLLQRMNVKENTAKLIASIRVIHV